MLYFIAKCLLSGLIIATVSTVAKRSPAFGALIASLPLISLLGMIWLWHDTHDPARMAAHAGATFWYVLPSLPMFLLLPALLNRGIGFWSALVIGCVLTIGLYAAMTWFGARVGLKLQRYQSRPGEQLP